ncbi:MAG: ParB/RepB/Spo0J family partition protein [Alistipes sp.]|nr:ParB/RepB/Spo0J family partition protein [Alistipes sp.]
MKQKGLGRGLDAIFGSEPIDVKTKPMSEMTEIAVADIEPNPLQPRREFDEEALAELADSLRTLGVIQPVTVRRNGDGKYMLISGERRWRASQIAGLETLPAYVRDVEDADLHAMALVENVQREDLNAIEIALGLQRLVEECGLTQDALSGKVGMKRSTVSNYMRLLKLPAEVQLALKEGVISMGHAKALAGAEERRQLPLLRKCIRKDMSVRQLEEIVRADLQKPAPKAVSEDEEYPEVYLRLVEQLERLFSQDIAIKRSKNGGGKIIIGFAGDEDIERLVGKFKKI